MADQIEILKRLQAIDGELYRLRKEQEQKPRVLEQVTVRVRAEEAKLKETESRLKSLQLAQKEKEIELQTREANVKKLQGQLFQVRTNKEYTAMQREIENLKADNSLLEEAILKTLDAIDRAGKDREAQQRKVAGEQQQLQTERQRIEQELAVIGERLAQLERQRHTLVPDVPGESLALYERVLSIRDGVALVPLLNDVCGGCHRRMPPQVVNEVYLKATLVTCENCNRILYFDEAHSKL